MPANRLTALVVGRPTAPAFLDEFSRSTSNILIETTLTPSLQDARGVLASEEFDLVLLLGTDAQLLKEEVVGLRRAVPGTGLIVVTRLDSVNDVVQFVRCGADDALNDPPSTPELEHSILLAMERRAAISREGALLVRFSSPPATSVTSTLFGGTLLRISHPSSFDAAVRDYAEIMDLAIEEKAFKQKQEVPARLKELAERLGTLRASPRDVIEMHTAALGEKFRSGQVGRVQAHVEEGKLLLLELMGHVLSFYRSYAAVFWSRPRAGDAMKGTQK